MKDNNVINLVDYLKHSPLKNTKFYDGLKSQSVLIKRTYALIIDFCIVLSVNLLALYSYYIFISEYFGHLPYQMISHMREIETPILFSIFTTLFFGYFLFCNYALNGQTIGKMIYKLRTVDRKFLVDHEIVDTDLNFKQSLRRSIAYCLSYGSFGILFFLPFITEDQMSFADAISNSKTISEDYYLNLIENRKLAKDQILIEIKALPLKIAS